MQFLFYVCVGKAYLICVVRDMYLQTLDRISSYKFSTTSLFLSSEKISHNQAKTCSERRLVTGMRKNEGLRPKCGNILYCKIYDVFQLVLLGGTPPVPVTNRSIYPMAHDLGADTRIVQFRYCLIESTCTVPVQSRGTQ